MSSFEQLEKQLKEKLSEKRYKHTLGVAYTAASLAMTYNCDISRAYLAGLLHDNAKAYSNDKKIRLCEKYNISISDVEYKNPGLLHAKLGSYMARKKFDIQDEEILRAIEFHTTGVPGMSLLEQIIFIADYIEPHRTPIPNLDQVRYWAFKDLDKAVLLELEGTMNYVKSKGAVFDPITLETYEYYKNIVAE